MPVGGGVVRWVGVIVAFVGVVVLGAVQLASSAAYGDLAARPSLPAALADHAPHLLNRFLDGPSHVRVALREGDTIRAMLILTRLPRTAVTEDLRGQVAEAVGEPEDAVDAYVSAHDVVRAQVLIDRRARADVRGALGDQQRLIDAISDDPNAAEVLGEAWWRLGQLQAAAGYQDHAQRSRYWREAEASYERALQLAPNEETYLLAAAYQSLANGDSRASLRYYQRAADVVPNSLDAWIGLAWAASMAHDCASAHGYFARAREIERVHPTDHADAFRNGLAGAALRRCVK